MTIARSNSALHAMEIPSATVVRQRLVDALATLRERDADMIRRNPSERSLTHRLAVYIEEQFPGWHVDCEFNRDADVPKRVNLNVPEAISPYDEDAVTVFPDIVVHRRGVGPNLLVVEAKKVTSTAGSAFDTAKLRAYKDQLKYRHAAFVVLPAGRRKGPPIKWLDEES